MTRVSRYCILLLLPVCAFGQSAEERTPAMVEAHIQQARRLGEPITSRSASDELAELRKEIETKLEKWQRQLAQEQTMPALLIALPASVRQQAQTAANDEDKARALLRTQFGLPLLLALTAERNPGLRAAYENWRAQLRQFDQAAYLEDMLSQYRAFVRELDTKVGPQKHKEMPAKTFPFPSTLTLKGQLVDLAAQLAKLEYETVLRQRINEMARAFFDVQYLTQALALVRENRALVAQMVDFTKARLRAAGGTQADALKAQSMLALLDNEIRTLEKQKATALDSIASLVDVRAGKGQDVKTGVDLRMTDLSAEEALSRASAGKQEWKAARVSVERTRLMVRLAETMVLPRGSAGMSQLAPSVGAEAGPTRKKSAAFPTRPMVDQRHAGFGANAAWIDELRVRVSRARKALDATAARSRFTVEEALSAVKIAGDDLKVYRDEVEPRARQALKSTSDRYNNALVPFVEYLDAMRAVLDADLKRERARRDLNRSLTRLMDSMGRTAADLLHGDKAKVVPGKADGWTCSMHPQVSEAQPGKCPICHMPLVEANGDAAKGVPGKKAVWTCSMHPQIKMAEPGKCPICAMTLVEKKGKE